MMLNDEHNERLVFMVHPSDAFPKEPATALFGDDARRAYDARALRRAAALMGQHGNPKNMWARFCFTIIDMNLNKLAKEIEEGTVKYD